MKLLILFLERKLCFKLIILRKYMANGKRGWRSTILNTAIMQVLSKSKIKVDLKIEISMYRYIYSSDTYNKCHNQ